MLLNDKIASQNECNDQKQQQQSDELERQQAQILADIQRQQQEYLALYRQALLRIQKEDPVAAHSMPGINAAESEIREKEIVEDMGRINYSKRYCDLTHQYRHVILPKNIAKWLPVGKLMKESEWRTLGVIQTPGWTHYMIHDPEPHVLLFKRPLDA